MLYAKDIFANNYFVLLLIKIYEIQNRLNMKNTFILLLSLLFFSSCEDNPTQIIEYKVDKYQYIETYPLNTSNIYIRDNDTLKIGIKDTNVVKQIDSFRDILTVTASLNDRSYSWVYEEITSDLTVERNPERMDEFWVFGFKANLDSNRRFLNSRFDYYFVKLELSKLNPYYDNSFFQVDVKSSTE